MTDVERAWAAGFFDGEGNTSFQLSKGKYKSIAVRITQKAINREVLDKFRSIMGIGTVSRPYIPNNNSNTDPYCMYTVSNITSVQTVMDVMWEYLGTAKRQQALKAISDFRGSPVPENSMAMTHEERVETRELNEFVDDIFGPGKKRVSRKKRSWFNPI